MSQKVDQEKFWIPRVQLMERLLDAGCCPGVVALGLKSRHQGVTYGAFLLHEQDPSKSLRTVFAFRRQVSRGSHQDQ